MHIAHSKPKITKDRQTVTQNTIYLYYYLNYTVTTNSDYIKNI